MGTGNIFKLQNGDSKGGGDFFEIFGFQNRILPFFGSLRVEEKLISGAEKLFFSLQVFEIDQKDTLFLFEISSNEIAGISEDEGVETTGEKQTGQKEPILHFYFCKKARRPG